MIRLENILVEVNTAREKTHATQTTASSSQRRILSVRELHVARGETVALVGASGCGKTTLLSLVAGLRRPTRGRVEVAGTDLETCRGYRLDLFRAAHVGVVFQAFNLLETSPVRRNLELPLLLSGRRGPAATAWVHTLLERVGLADRAAALPRHLSAGERQRLAVARALAGGAPLVLADEPTGNLDPENTAAVMDLLFEFADRGNTLVVATHDETILDRFARVVEMKNLVVA